MSYYLFNKKELLEKLHKNIIEKVGKKKLLNIIRIIKKL